MTWKRTQHSHRSNTRQHLTCVCSEEQSPHLLSRSNVAAPCLVSMLCGKFQKFFGCYIFYIESTSAQFRLAPSRSSKGLSLLVHRPALAQLTLRHESAAVSALHAVYLYRPLRGQKASAPLPRAAIVLCQALYSSRRDTGTEFHLLYFHAAFAVFDDHAIGRRAIRFLCRAGTLRTCHVGRLPRLRRQQGAGGSKYRSNQHHDKDLSRHSLPFKTNADVKSHTRPFKPVYTARHRACKAEEHIA